MKTAYRINWLSATALLLALPTAYFILISVLKYMFGVDGPFDSMQPTLEQLGIKESLGLNINLLILFGPVIALIIAAAQVLKIQFQFTKDQFDFHIQVKHIRGRINVPVVLTTHGKTKCNNATGRCSRYQVE